jgi:hypothetical protein
LQGIRPTQNLFLLIHRGDVACDRNLTDQNTLGVQQRRRLESDPDELTTPLAPLGGRCGRTSRANALEQARIIGLGEICGMQCAQRLTDGFLCGKAVQRGRFPVPVRDHRIQVLDDNGLAALLEDLREISGARLRSLVRGTGNAV